MESKVTPATGGTPNCKDSYSDEPSTLLVSMPAAPSASAFCIRRSSHSHDLVRDFSLMLQDEDFVDVTLMCEDGSLNAHKMFLSSYSPYFKSIFSKLAASVNKSNYPVIVLKDLPFCDLRAIVDFIYRGEVTVPQTQWKSLVKSAESLKIRGLVGLRDPDSSDVTINNKKRRKRRKKRSASASDGKTTKDGTYECSSDASASVSDGQSVSDADSYDGSEGDEEYDSSTQITAVQGDERNSVSTVGDVEPSNLMEQSMIVSGDASESASLCNRNSYTPNPPVGDHTGLVSQMDAMNDSMNHHANSSPIGGLLNFDQHPIHPVAGPSSGHSGLARTPGPMAAQESNTNTSTSSNSNTNNNTSNNNNTNSNTTTTSSSNNNNSNNNTSSSSHGHGHSHGTTGSRGCLHQCPYCLKRFEVRYSLIRHIRVIHNPQRHVYTCPTCGRRFAWKSAYLRHTNHCTCNKANF